MKNLDSDDSALISQANLLPMKGFKMAHGVGSSFADCALGDLKPESFDEMFARIAGQWRPDKPVLDAVRDFAAYGQPMTLRLFPAADGP